MDEPRAFDKSNETNDNDMDNDYGNEGEERLHFMVLKYFLFCAVLLH
jgi:hypothetical protein